ncbi:unnamed protein product [Meloidogyne enterolobii]|uniref:Uncharacterized protein n=1 Tax=Meloidogyne enterolobii TaxID=390850 RepID=A0ACB1A1A2_MELEN
MKDQNNNYPGHLLEYTHGRVREYVSRKIPDIRKISDRISYTVSGDFPRSANLSTQGNYRNCSNMQWTYILQCVNLIGRLLKTGLLLETGIILPRWVFLGGHVLDMGLLRWAFIKYGPPWGPP